MTTFKANRKFPNPITVTDDPKSHTLALQQVIEALNVGQRRTREVNSSYVRVHELVDVGLIEVVGNQLKLTNLGQSVAAGGSTTLAGLTDVDLTGLADGDVLTYNSATMKWEPVAPTVSDPFDPTDMYAAALNDLADVSFGPPTDGDVLTYNASTGLWEAAAAATGAAITGYAIFPPTSVSRNTTTTLATDAELDVQLSANTRYRIEYDLRIDSAAAPDFKWAFAFTGTVTAVFIGSDNADATTASLATGAVVSGTGGFLSSALGAVRTHTIAGTDSMLLRIVMNIDVGATGGTLSFQWAQATSSGTNVTRHKDSSVLVVPEGATAAEESSVQASDMVITSNTTLTNTDLVTETLQPGTYSFEMHFATVSHATPDMNVALAFSGTLADFYGYMDYSVGASGGNIGLFALGVILAYNTTSSNVTNIKGSFQVTAAGVFSVKAAQNSSSATAVTFKRGSWLRVRRLV